MTHIAILGFGVVGSGVAEALAESAALIEARCGFSLSLKYILDIRQFPDSPFADAFVPDFSVIENDPDVEVVAEAIGGTGAAYDFTKRALRAGKHVVTSNKELVAEHGAELLALARTHRVHYLFEASVGGGIPVIHPLALCLSANRVDNIVGILNGTSNYILTRMKQNGFTFDEALREAQKLGYAEADPSDDVQGKDCTRKICILASLVFGRQISPASVYTEGITAVTPEQLAEAEQAGYAIKLLGRAHGRASGHPFVLTAPHLVPSAHPLYNVSDVFNAILVSGSIVDDIMFYGRGAGKRPTASAIVSDILDCLRGGDPLGGHAWSDVPMDCVSKLDGGNEQLSSVYTFADGTNMRIL